MAVDVLILPLTKYWAGAYVTPEMEARWAKDEVCRIERVGGVTEDRPPGMPLGGEDAAANRTKLLGQIDAYLASLPHDIASLDWDERAEGPGVVGTIDHEVFGALFREARRVLEAPPSIWDRMWGRFTTASHLVNARIFVGRDFEKAFRKKDDVFGSLPVLLRELEAMSFSDQAREGAVTLQKAAEEARVVGLPLILDV